MQMTMAIQSCSGLWEYWFGIPNVLYSAEPVIKSSFFSKKDEFIENSWRHHTYWSIDNRPKDSYQIIDSGLYSILYGQLSSKHRDEKSIYKWMDIYKHFVNNHFKDRCLTDNRPYFVEIDAQDIVGQEKEWQIREDLKKSCPGAKWINVWHSDDGMYGLDRLIEFADYIAIGFAPSGVAHPKYVAQHPEDYARVVRYVKSRKPEMKIHTLGVTNPRASEVYFDLVDTCDSSTWSHPFRHGIQTVGEVPTEIAIKMGKALRPLFDNVLGKEFYIPATEKSKDGMTWALVATWSMIMEYNKFCDQINFGDDVGIRPVMEKLWAGNFNVGESDLGRRIYETIPFKIKDKTWFIPPGYEHIGEKLCKAVII